VVADQLDPAGITEAQRRGLATLIDDTQEAAR